MAKMVIYNGGTQSYYGCTDPTDLVQGQIYEVIDEQDRGWQTDYTLKGITGHFNSCWFNEIPTTSEEKVFMALSHSIPVVDREYSCSRITTNSITRPMLVSCKTSLVKNVTSLGSNIYLVTTCNSLYIVQVI